MTQPETPKERLMRLHGACLKARMEASHERDDISGAYDALGKAEAAFLTYVSSLFLERTEGEDEVERVARAICHSDCQRAVRGSACFAGCSGSPHLETCRKYARTAIAALSPPARDTRESGRAGYTVDLQCSWDSDAAQWIVTSKSIVGLVIGAASFSELGPKLDITIPALDHSSPRSLPDAKRLTRDIVARGLALEFNRGIERAASIISVAEGGLKQSILALRAQIPALSEVHREAAPLPVSPEKDEDR